MSDLTLLEKQKFEAVLGMASGYVLNFGDRTFAEFRIAGGANDRFIQRLRSGISHANTLTSKRAMVTGIWYTRAESSMRLIGLPLTDHGPK